MYEYYSYMEDVRQKIAKIRHDSKQQFYVKIQNCWDEKEYDFLFEVFLKFKNQLIKIVNETKDGEDVLEMIEKTVDISVFKDIVSNYEENTNKLFYKDVFETLKHVYLSLFNKEFIERHKSTIENGKFFTMCDKFNPYTEPSTIENPEFVICNDCDIFKCQRGNLQTELKEVVQPLDEDVFILDKLDNFFQLSPIPLFVKNINLCLDAIYDARRRMVTVLKKKEEQNAVECQVKIVEENAVEENVL